MKTIFYALLLAAAATVPAYAQFPTNSFAVTSACPGSAGNPSILEKINTNGTLTPVGTVHEGNTNLIVNGLGNDVMDLDNLYALNVTQPVTASNFNTPPNLYRISLTTAEATPLGAVTRPPAISYSFPSPYVDIAQTFNFIGDGDNQSNYFVAGATVRYNFITNEVDNVRLYVGQIRLTPFTTASPTWRELDTSEPATSAIIATYRDQVQAFADEGFSGPVPEGGIQDWVFDPFTNHLVSCLGQDGLFLTIRDIDSAPVATTTRPTVPLPVRQDIGAMFTDRVGNVYAVTADVGTIYKVDRVTGDYSGKSYGSALGCNRGDAVSFRDALPLPVELTSFTARAAPQGVAVAWATASEKDAATFQLERSPDGQQWQTWRAVPATNRAAGARYAALDAAPLPGTSYYRLLMVDQDGTTAYSPVQNVTLVAPAAALEAFPNPAGQVLTVRSASPGDQLQVLNSTGQVVWRQTDGSAGAQISVAAWPAGLYYVRSQGSGHALLSQKIVVVH